jgi:hypothetical protein
MFHDKVRPVSYFRGAEPSRGMGSSSDALAQLLSSLLTENVRVNRNQSI